MTNSELSNEFDVLYNNITSNQAPGLNEYEKSVFLTKAQSQLVNEYFNNRTDGFGGGFDGSQKRQYDFSSLTRVSNLYELNTFKDRISDIEKLDKRSKVFLFPKDYYLAVNEILTDSKKQYSVIPINHIEYQRLMSKPYNLPIKRGAWRLLTDKKNCNYYHEYAKVEEDKESTADYTFLSGWADNKRNMSITIISRLIESGPSIDESLIIEVPNITLSDGTHPRVYVEDKYIYFFTKIGNASTWNLLHCDSGWSGDRQTYEVKVTLQSGATLDDEDTVEYLKTGFELANYYVKSTKQEHMDWETIKSMTHTEGFHLCSAPGKFYEFSRTKVTGGQTMYLGKTFTTEVVQIPIAEIIGKFDRVPTYQLRYVKTLKPIILEDLDTYGEELSISGYSKITECELPEETHQEILERAVTLAKIAWQGGTSTQAQSKE
jgi:hypothetical protein